MTLALGLRSSRSLLLDRSGRARSVHHRWGAGVLKVDGPILRGGLGFPAVRTHTATWACSRRIANVGKLAQGRSSGEKQSGRGAARHPEPKLTRDAVPRLLFVQDARPGPRWPGLFTR